MNTLIVTILRYNYKLLKQYKTSPSQGFTLIELLIVVLILGILAAYAFPAFTAVVDKSKYGDARTQMSCMAKELKIYKLENGTYPKDVNPNINPSTLKCFYLINTGQVPFNNDKLNPGPQYDYEGRATKTPDGQTACAYYILFYGKDGIRDTTTGNYTPAMNGDNKFYENKDDLLLSIDLVNMSSSRIPIDCR